MNKKRVLTGTRPSGIPHLGNYFGAYEPAIRLQESYELFFFLADFHALNSEESLNKLYGQSLDIVATMLACGFDPEKSHFYAQSMVPEVCELMWFLSCQMPYGMAARAHSFKDALNKNREVNLGVFCYPVLMAADILLYDAQVVPVGQDQKQHLEMARDLAQRFNRRYGESFVIPEALISEQVAVVPGTDGQKMSKSKGNVIPIFATDKQWKKAVMSIVTDSKGVEEIKDPQSCTVFKLYALIEKNPQKIEAMADAYRSGGYGYGHAKLALLEALKEYFGPMRDQYFKLREQEDYLLSVIDDGSKRVRPLALQKLHNLREKMGLVSSCVIKSY